MTSIALLYWVLSTESWVLSPESWVLSPESMSQHGWVQTAALTAASIPLFTLIDLLNYWIDFHIFAAGSLFVETHEQKKTGCTGNKQVWLLCGPGLNNMLCQIISPGSWLISVALLFFLLIFLIFVLLTQVWNKAFIHLQLGDKKIDGAIDRYSR